MITFKTNAQFLAWVAEHQQDGFFVGYAYDHPPKATHYEPFIPRLHLTTCKYATTKPNHVEGDYGKDGSLDRDELIAKWGRHDLEYCEKCNPLNDTRDRQ